VADTVEKIVRRLQGLCPLAPTLTALSWVQDAHKRIMGERPWAELRGEGVITVLASRTGTVTLTNGSAVVQGTSLVFATTDVGRQLRPSSSLPYSILSVDTGANTATLDQVFYGTSAAGVTVTVLDAYTTMPADFGRFIAVVDPPNRRQLRIFITEEELNYYDPSRTITGQPRALVSRKLSPVAATLGQVQYEIIPYPVNAAAYPYYYVKTPPDLTLDSVFNGPLRARGDVVQKVAILECCKWPGLGLSPDKVNPYFRISSDRIQLMVAEAEHEIAKLEARDEEIYSTWLEEIGLNQFPYYSLPFVSADIRSSDIDYAARF
jgi:hypothetical protein